MEQKQRIAAMKAGCDLNMPGGNRYMEQALPRAVHSGEPDEACIDACVERILRLAESMQGLRTPKPISTPTTGWRRRRRVRTRYC